MEEEEDMKIQVVLDKVSQVKGWRNMIYRENAMRIAAQFNDNVRDLKQPGKTLAHLSLVFILSHFR